MAVNDIAVSQQKRWDGACVVD